MSHIFCFNLFFNMYYLHIQTIYIFVHIYIFEINYETFMFNKFQRWRLINKFTNVKSTKKFEDLVKEYNPNYLHWDFGLLHCFEQHHVCILLCYLLRVYSLDFTIWAPGTSLFKVPILKKFMLHIFINYIILFCS